MTLHGEIADALRARIIAGEYPVGSRVPSESSLCAEFGTSRGPVRQAVDTLRREGLLDVRRGRQPVVVDSSASQPFSELVSFTEWAESEGRVPGQQTIAVSRIPAGERIAELMGCDAETPVVEVIRLRKLDGKPAMLEGSTFPLEVGQLLFTSGFDPDEGSIYRLLLESGVDLYKGRHTFDAVLADERDADLLDIPENSPILRVCRVVVSSSGDVLEVAEDRYRPGVANIVVENTRSEISSVVQLRSVAAG